MLYLLESFFFRKTLSFRFVFFFQMEEYSRKLPPLVCSQYCATVASTTAIAAVLTWDILLRYLCCEDLITRRPAFPSMERGQWMDQSIPLSLPVGEHWRSRLWPSNWLHREVVTGKMRCDQHEPTPTATESNAGAEPQHTNNWVLIITPSTPNWFTYNIFEIISTYLCSFIKSIRYLCIEVNGY